MPELLLFVPGGLVHPVQFQSHPALEASFCPQRLTLKGSLNEMKLIAFSLSVAYPPESKTY
uniref:Uncharacterized protein n=1 Tax=uncultured marine bacterium MedDCM-OCT-S04-C7 TaxID=743059 RepID=D6PD63_9BACT|nr:hypothetical protein [uncultured marine bacterium MedDCM-OCT-S04-C7]